MKLNKKSLLALIGGTVLLSLALVGCVKTETTAPTTKPTEQNVTDENTDVPVEDGDGVVTEDGVEVEAVATSSSDLYEKLIDGLELPASIQLDENLLADVYGLNSDDIASYCVAIPMMNVHATEIAIFEIKDGNTEAIENAIKERQAGLEKTWGTYLPEQYDLVKQSKVVTKGDFVLYVINNNADDIVAKFETLVTDVVENK